MNEQKRVPLQSYNSKQLAALYGISVKVLNKWIEPNYDKIGPKLGQLFSVLQVEIIFRLRGWPFEKRK